MMAPQKKKTFRLLDLFCGAGGCSVGYSRAGFDVIVGVDNRPMPNYPFEFHEADALCYLAKHGHEFDVIHASPPCQAYSTATPISRRRRHKEHADLVAPTRDLLERVGVPYIIENVPSAPLRPFSVLLCGSMFGLDVQRHRLFESSHLLFSPGDCQHSIWTPRFRSLDSRQKTLAKVIGVHGNLNYQGEAELRKKAMGIDWMNTRELTQAIPPAYTECLGKQLLRHLTEP